MIKSWKVTNFKSYRDETTIELTNINVLAGANSSGKSSIIQSILLLKQTLQYGSANRPLSLNGPLLRLGSFDDVRNFDAGDEDLRLAMEFVFKPEDALAASPWARHLNRYYQGSRTETLQSLSVDLAFHDRSQGQSAIVTASSLTPVLTSAEVRTRRGTEGSPPTENYVSLVRRNPNPTEDDEAPYQYWRHEVELDGETKSQAFADKPDATLAGGMYSYFLPAWVAVNFNTAAQSALQISSKIFETQLFSHGPDLDDETVSPDIVILINDFLAENGGDIIESSDYVPASLVRERISPYMRNSWTFSVSGALGLDPSDSAGLARKASVARLREQVTSKMLEEAIPEFTVDFEAPPVMAVAKDFVQEYFKTGIRYLGPLRDSPRPVYQLEALESTTDVGYRGEHTAAILDLNSSRRIAYRRPPVDAATGTDENTVFARVSGTLHDAVVEWLTYLGVATEVATTDAGVFGNRLQVSTDSAGRLHDLTNVGVGVSQVLPIVVMALLAQKGSFLIFEQPELHLHPKVQARLADFFLSLALDGKQMLLETHSEYLIDRFRLRIALSIDDQFRDLISMLFSEKVGSTSTLKPIRINEFGAIVDWPKDFFEQSDKDVGRILRAATQKRQSKQK